MFAYTEISACIWWVELQNVLQMGENLIACKSSYFKPCYACQHWIGKRWSPFVPEQYEYCFSEVFICAIDKGV